MNRSHFRLVLSAMAMSVVVSASGGAGAVDLLSHRAVYKMKMDKRGSGADMVDAGGVTVYQFSKGCDGWIMENQSSLNMINDDGNLVKTFWRFSTWESFDGSMYKFHSRHSSEGQVIEDIRGEANLDKGSLAGNVSLESPDKSEISLEAGTLFPTRHLEELVKEAAQGHVTYSANVFDGATLDNPYQVNAVLLSDKNPAAAKTADGGALPRQPSWTMRFAYFPRDSKVPEPDFEMEVVYRADGVATSIRQLFPHFSLSGDLVGVELIPDSDC